MSRIKSILLGLWVLVFASNHIAFGQPSECITPPAGYSLGGDFQRSQNYACFNGIVTSSAPFSIVATQGINPATAQYQFNYKGGTFKLNPVGVKDTTFTNEGVYYVVQVAKDGAGNNVINCKAFEIIKTDIPEIESNTCGPLSASIKILDTPKNQKQAEYTILWGDSNNPETFQAPPYNVVRSHTYASPNLIIQPKVVGIYKRNGVGVCTSQPAFFSIGNDSAPKITELKGLNGGAEQKITFAKGNENQDYTVQQKPKSGTTWTDTPIKIKRASGSTTANGTVTGLATNSEYCFRLQRVDPSCSIPTLSNEVCNINMTAQVISSKDVKLDWNVPASPNVVDLSKYTVRISDQANSVYPGYDRTTNNFLYDLMECTKKYKFNVTAIYPARSSNDITVQIISPEIDVDPKTAGKLPPKTIGTVSIANPSEISVIVYEISGFAEKKYKFFRAEGGSDNYSEIKVTDTNSFVDKAVEPDKTQYCYKVMYFNECDSESELSPAFCSVYLNSRQTNTLNWTPFVIPDPNNTTANGQEIKYFVELVDANGVVLNVVETTKEVTSNVSNVINVVLDNPASQGRVSFRIKAVQRAGLLINGVIEQRPFEVLSNIYTFITPAQLFVPNAFSPNGDNEPSSNEIFKAYGRFISEFNMIVYDRWGKPIFETNDIATGWNGMEVDGNTPAPPGNYAYKIFGKDTAGQKFEKLGAVMLLK